MSEKKIIIVGAGAAGLIAATVLSRKGYSVHILEARDRIGGRIHTVEDRLTGFPLELGAEFIHGDLPATLTILKKAGISYRPMNGDIFQVKDGQPEEDDQTIEHWNAFHTKLKTLKKDMSVDAFLEKHFNAKKYAGLRESVRRYAAGYDTADPGRASVKTLGEEWANEDDSKQYRPETGYAAAMEHLLSEAKANGARITKNAVVKSVEWRQGQVTVTTAKGKTHKADKLLVTVPLSLLAADARQQAHIKFSPALPEVRKAAKAMGIGAIIKVLLLFKEPFWQREEVISKVGTNISDACFIFSKERVPTWWTQNPNNIPLLTGWLGGPSAAKLKRSSNAQLKTIALKSLSNILKVGVRQLEQLLTRCETVNWTADPFTLGSYSYPTLETPQARAVLTTPIEDTIYFAGEALYGGPEMGTVDAALRSGLDAAKRITSGDEEA